MRRPPLRWLVLVPTLFTVIVGFGAFAWYIGGVERSNLLADIDDELVRAEAAADLLPPGGGTGSPPPGELSEPTTGPPGSSDSDESGANADDLSLPVELLLTDGGDVIASNPRSEVLGAEALAELAGSSGTVSIDEPRYRALVSPRDDGTVMVTALSLERFDASMNDFRRTLLVGGVVILLLVSIVIWSVTAHAARPVTRMANTAIRIADGQLETSVDPPSGSRETAALAEALEDMLERLRSTIDESARAADDADQARLAMRRFVADMSHELRTPLTALKGYSDLYAGGMLDEPGALDRAMGRIGSESDRLNGLVNDMLQLAREAPATDTAEPFDVVDVVDVVVADLRAAHPEAAIDVHVDAMTDGSIKGQPARFHQAILNLTSNACRHAPPGTPVEVSVSSDDDWVTLRVADHGDGVDPDEADKIFLPFYRPDSARERDNGGGAGLGLAIASQVIERHGGTITVEQTPGGGATFVVTTPRH